jgi:phosphatidylglycerophosphatase A
MSHTTLNKTNRNRLIWSNPWVFIACGFGVGTLPVMPGTYGTLLGVGLMWLLSPLSLWFSIPVLVVLFVSGIFLCGYANRQFGTDDHPAAVWDEVVTFPWVLLGIPLTPVTIVVAFLLFRFFDIIKPWPIRWVDKNMHGGFGVMFDDWLAAIASLIVMHLYLWLF